MSFPAYKIGYGYALVKGRRVLVFRNSESLYYEARAKHLHERIQAKRAKQKIVLEFNEEE